MKRHPKINKCSTMFIPDSRVVNLVVRLKEIGVTAPLFLAPKFKISVSASELCTVKRKRVLFF